SGPATAAILSATQLASAALFQYDLRFVSGPTGSDITNDPSHQRVAIVGTYHIALWVQISGTNSTHTDESLLDAWPSVASAQVAGGVVAAGGLANGHQTAPFNQYPTYTGISSNLSNDGIG